MLIHSRKSLVHLILKNSSQFKPHHSFSLYFFSTITKNQPVSTATASDLLLNKHKFSPEAIKQLSSVFSHIRNPENSDSVLTFLKETGFSNTQLQSILKCKPMLLSSSLEKIVKPKIKVFQDSGFTNSDIAAIIANDPEIIYRSASNRVAPSLSVLKGLLGSNKKVATILKTTGWFLRYDLEKTMVPNVEFLKRCGVKMEQILWLMYNFPRCLLSKPDTMCRFVQKIDEMGIQRSSKMFVHAIRVLSSMTSETFEVKWKTFRNLGFSEDEIVMAFRKAPQVFAVSEEKIKKVKEVLVASGKYGLISMIENPTALMCSIEKRYKPRLKVLAILESKNLIGDWPSFGYLHRMTDDVFYKNFVGPFFDEVGHIYALKSSSSDKTKVKKIVSA